MLEIRDLFVEVEGKEILKGVSLSIKSGEIHALMGPNGSGKSSLSLAVMGHPKYKITKGEILLNGKSILNLPVNDRAKLGLFLGFQYPQETEGVGVSNFLRTSLLSLEKVVPEVMSFHNELKEKMQSLGLKEEFLKRGLNVGYSGGEKKRSEILQMSVLKPKIAILDEPDSGTDVDGLKVIANGIGESSKEGAGILLITHYNKILQHVKPDFVHVLVDGKITKSGGPELAEEIEKSGYEVMANAS
jgi:Fe-S cluster assembly ATP-binding protein